MTRPDPEFAAPPGTALVMLASLALGALCSFIALIGLLAQPHEFLRAYLWSYLVFAGLSMGCLGIWMMSSLTGGAWGTLTRRLLEAGARGLPLLVVLFIPIAIGVRALFPWARPEEVAREPILQHKHLYLNVPFFILRAVFYYAVLGLFLHFMCRLSAEQDRRDDLRLQRRLRMLSGPGLVAICLVVSWAYIDWAMSLEPRWFSSVFGMIILTGQGMAVYALLLIAVTLLSLRPPMSRLLSTKLIHDLGKLQLAFVMLWAYTSFAQLIITWAGNLPDEIIWYIPRWHHGWAVVSCLLIALQFSLPFVFLLSQRLKQQPWRLLWVAALILGMHFVEMFWTVTPEFSRQRLHVSWLDVIVPLAMGSWWLAYCLFQLQRRPLVPRYAPYLDEVLDHEPDRFPK